MNSQEALAKLVRGVAKYQAEVFPAYRKVYEELQHEQHPIAMLFTCADSRLLTNLILQAGPGEIFTERTPGNIVPKYSDHVGGVTASMEYANRVLEVPLMIVCGHTDCGVVKALLEPEKAAGMPALQSWMRHALPARERLLRDHPKSSKEEKLHTLTEYNVLAQMENLKTHPTVEERLASGDLLLQGWIYDIATGGVSVADPDTGVFAALPNSP